MSIRSIWVQCASENQAGASAWHEIPATQQGVTDLGTLLAGHGLTLLNAWPIGSVYFGTANPNSWCGGTWEEAANHKSWTRTA